MKASKSKNTNHVEKLTFFGEHTLVAPPPRPGFKEALRKKIKTHYLEIAESEIKEKPILSPFAKYAGIFFSLLFTLLITVGGVTVYYKNLPSKTVTANQRIATSLAYVEGQVQVLRGGSWVDLIEKSDLFEGEKIKLSENARAIISFEDRADIRLSSESEVELFSLKDKHIIVNNNFGEVYARVTPNNGSVFEVRIDSVSYESLGTAFKTINTSKKQGVEVYHSKVKIKQKDSAAEVIVEEGNQYFVKNEEDKSAENKIVPVQVEVLAQDNFIQWNRAQDEEKVNSEALGVLNNADLFPSINLSLKEEDKGILLTWTKENLPNNYTYKILTGDNAEIGLDNLNATIEDKSSQAYILQPSRGMKTLYAKVCVFVDESCIATSNVASIDVSESVLGIKDEVLISSVRLVKEESIGALIIRWYIEPNNVQGVEGFKIEYDKLNPKTKKITEKEVILENIYDRKYIIYTPDFEVNSYIKVCVLQNNECILYSNEITIEREEIPLEEDSDTVEQTNLDSNNSTQVEIETN
ncbi:FecR domain-containing protein [Candidatus Dojkabacteria bacterium]|uniref:FecR domain-containing protein n=1 Tax=Candidatus Dojkabacteria bacterium TaxID=2099670 RepID=A0A955LA41_9BACT|nr:FecR domain-containing protein [Candidatus Dojkabacteria bacterium]